MFRKHKKETPLYVIEILDHHTGDADAHIFSILSAQSIKPKMMRAFQSCHVGNVGTFTTASLNDHNAVIEFWELINHCGAII